jgi:hypothetical protein
MIDLTGQKFGRLNVQSFAGAQKKHFYWNCVCDCGNTKRVGGGNLKSGHTKSCGCVRDELITRVNSNKQMLDLIGRRFGRLMVQEFVGKDKHKQPTWRCICDCGATTEVSSSNLKGGRTQSCGCYNKEVASLRSTTHGQTKGGNKSKTYKTWADIKSRCYDVNHPRYEDYGGRGIKVYLPWHKFENFYKDVGDIPEGMTFDRIDNDGNYEPGNWRFATYIEQNNNRRDNVWKEYKGERKTIAQWSRDLGINQQTLRNRLGYLEWSIERAFTTPVRKRRK